ncbi:hypothetical protein GGX14DRAFT_565210 [Mycena pura]|uniref:Uncharacterized protein n=1 Tax=Mycena pura TaxID=153505 RepID=A0AAD6VJD0_9AGAR|nr:hypothetical protein GGX14DRAFT_565210 [Mycena pura]
MGPILKLARDLVTSDSSPHLLPLPAVRLLSHLLHATSVASTFTFARLATPVLRTLILTPATSAMGTSSCEF